MPRLGSLDDLDLTTVELEDGTPLLAAWRPDDDGGGTWVARASLPASAVTIELETMPNLLSPGGFYPASAPLQDVVTSFLRDGFNSFRSVTEEDPDGPSQARSCLITDYQRRLDPLQIGTNGSIFGLSYGRPGRPAGGWANLTTLVGEVLGSEDPSNEIGGCIASLQLGKGGHPAPTASLWGSSYTLRGSVDRQPGGLMAYTAVVQNYFDGSGSRSANYGYAAVTRPGIGDGADFHDPDPIRHSTTYPVDLGFVVCGDSGPSPDGGGIGYRVAFQAGGAASPWAAPAEWRSRIGTGLVVRDWLEGGIHVHPPHPDAAAAPQLRLDRRDAQDGDLLECRTEDGTHVLASIRPDGRISAAEGSEPGDLITRAQLSRELEALRQELRGADVRSVPTRALGRELASRVPVVGARAWRAVRRRGPRSVRTPDTGERGASPRAELRGPG